MDEKIVSVTLNAFIIAGAAAATPPFGPIIGQYGVNTSQFCKEFNEFTEPLKLFSAFDDFEGAFSIDELDGVENFLLVGVEVKIFEDRSFNFRVCRPSASFLLMFFSNLDKGNTNEVLGVIPFDIFLKLALFKFPALSAESAVSLLKGTARAIGIRIL